MTHALKKCGCWIKRQYQSLHADKAQWQLDFLPEYQAILKKPPASVGRYLGLGISFLVVLLLLWSCFFHMDIVATAHGKLTAVQGSKTIQSSVFGEVIDIKVTNGDQVAVDQLLIQLDDREMQARATMIRGLVQDTKIDIARFEALQENEPEGAFVPPEGLTDEQISDARDRLRTTLYHYQTQVDGLRQQPGKANEPKIMNTEMRVRAFKSEFQEKTYSRLARAKNRLLELTASLVQVEDEIESMSIRSPVAGQVQELSINTFGAVLEPAQKLMVIVPDDIQLSADVMILSKDVGFIRVAQSVEVKVDSFPYTRFGTVAGKISAIAKDAIADEKQGLLYAANVQIEKQAIVVTEGVRQLKPGMRVTAEIKTGRRRIISYLLSPLQEYQSETLKER